MIVEPLNLPGCLRLIPKTVHDTRGAFIKPFVEAEYKSLKLPTTFAEEYYTRSVKNVLRGMHYQTPPYEYSKFVSCLYGRIRDVIIDLRLGSPKFKIFEVIELDDRNDDVLYLPPGIAHGFLVLSEMAVVTYKVTSAHAPAKDTGVRWDSIGMDWEVEIPIVSPRDASFQGLAEFESPFLYQPEEIFP
jgi:dTDP-4-dehydrorhamnose 3,5-epimerase